MSVNFLLDLMYSRKSHRELKGMPTKVELEKLALSCFLTPTAGGIWPFTLLIALKEADASAGASAGAYAFYDASTIAINRPPLFSESLDFSLLCNGQQWVNSAPAIFIWCFRPESLLPRYSNFRRCLDYALLDAGHSCQNMYLMCEALELGMCAIGAFDYKKMIDLVAKAQAYNGSIPIYLAAVGRIK